MKVSVIVPVYNVEKFIGKCIDSLLAQTMTDYEIILVDDGSKDSSGQICDDYASRYENIQAYHKDNEGLAATRNYGLDRASGEWIVFVDSDDWVEKDYLEILLSTAVDKKADIVVCDYMRNSGDEMITNAQDCNVIERTGSEAIGRIYSRDYVKYVVAWNKIYRRKIWENLRYTPGIINEDEAVCAQALFAADKVIDINQKLYNYRVNNSESIMSVKYSLKRLDILKALEIRMDFYKEKGLQKYYEDDSFKYMYKILLNIIEIQKAEDIENKKNIIKDLKEKYWDKEREAKQFDWSAKRKLAMKFFGLCPKAYLLYYKG